jgi:hypothetical protein
MAEVFRHVTFEREGPRLDLAKCPLLTHNGHHYPGAWCDERHSSGSKCDIVLIRDLVG